MIMQILSWPILLREEPIFFLREKQYGNKS